MTSASATKAENSTSAKPIPEGMHAVTPHIVCANASQAITFYSQAFGAKERFRLNMPDGKIMHAQIDINGSAIMLVDEMDIPECVMKGPKQLNGTPVTLHLYVKDVDATFRQAIAAGATVVMQPADMFWGDRYGVLTDPFGHRWSIATHLRDMTQEEIEEAARNFC